MKKLMRRIATVGIFAAAVGGTLLAAGGSATAATAETAQRTTPPAPPAATAAPGHRSLPHHTTRHRIDPWVADQLAMFHPAAAKRSAIFDPWVKDQLAQLSATAQ
ncbi:hypothetical protein ACH4UM_31895 [Streptomyces sp. NPDC020801]|uniref:hypothetical protein n=1 Tax=unclassified Streptomyces TaxID=2593676 RepID=UPI0037A0E2CC